MTAFTCDTDLNCSLFTSIYPPTFRTQESTIDEKCLDYLINVFLSPFQRTTGKKSGQNVKRNVILPLQLLICYTYFGAEVGGWDG